MDKKESISVAIINKPSKEESQKKIKELSEFLEKTWHLPSKTQ